MGLLEVIGALLHIVGVLLPTIVAAWTDQHKKTEEATDALVGRDVDALRQYLSNVVSQSQSVSAGSPPRSDESGTG